MEGMFCYGFIWKSIIAIFLSSIICAIIGSWVVVNKKVFLCGGITHSSFGGIGLAYYLGINPLIGGFVFALLSSLGIELFVQKKSFREDAAIGFFWAFFMALGIIFIYLTPGFAPDLLSYLFGNILTVNNTDIILLFIFSIFLIIWFSLNYYKILYVSFDSSFASSANLKVNKLNVILMLITATVIILNIKMSGVVLVLSLISIGQSAANLITFNFKNIIFLSFVFNFIAGLVGIILSWYLNIPCGATIIVVLSLIYLGIFLFKRIINKGGNSIKM